MGFNEELQDLIRRYKSGSATIIGIDQLKQDIEALTDAYVNNANQDEKIIKDLSISLKNARRELARKASPEAKNSFTGTEPPKGADLRPKLSGFDRMSANDPEFMSKLGSDYYQNASTAQKKQITQAVNLRRKIAQQNETIASFTEDTGPFASETYSVAELRSQRDEAQIKLNKLEKKLGVNATTASGSPILDAVIANQPKVNVPTKPVKTAEQLADEAAQAAVAAENKRLTDKLKGKTGPKQEIATTANSDILSDAASNYVPRDYDSKARRRELDKNERKEVLAEKAAKLREDHSLKHVARMSVQQMEWDEKTSARDTEASIKGADAAIKAENVLEQKRLADAQKNDEALLKEHQRYLNEQEMLNDRGAAEAKAYYAKQETDDARHIAHVTELGNKHNEEMRKQDEKTANDERRHIAHLTEMGNKHNEDIKKMDADAAKQAAQMQQRRDSAHLQSIEAQSTLMHRAGMAMSLAISYPLVELGKSAMLATEDMSRLKAGMTATMGSAELAGDQIERLAAVSKLPGLNFQDLVKGSLTLQNTGMTAEGAERTLRSFGNALAKAGKGSEELKGVQLALQQIMAKGKLVGQELRQLQERLPMIRAASIKAFGTSKSENLIGMGIGAKEYVRGITEVLEKEAKVPESFSNAMKNFSNEVYLFKVAVGEVLAPAVIQTTNMVTKMMGSFKELSPAMKSTAVQMGVMAAASGPLVLMGSQILQLEFALKRWQAEMIATGRAAQTMGSMVSGSLAGKLGILGIGIGAGILANNLISGGDTTSSSGVGYARRIAGGALGGGITGATAGFLVGGPAGALVGGAAGAIGTAAGIGWANMQRPNAVPGVPSGHMFQKGMQSEQDKAAMEKVIADNKAAERNAYMGLLQLQASQIEDPYKSAIAVADLKYEQDKESLSELSRKVKVDAENISNRLVRLEDEAQKAAVEHGTKVAVLKAKIAAVGFIPAAKAAGEKALKNLRENYAREKNTRSDKIEEQKLLVEYSQAEVDAMDDTTRMTLLEAQKQAAYTEAAKKKRSEEMKVVALEKVASRDAALAAAIYGRNDIDAQKITAVDTYKRTMESLTEMYQKGERVAERVKLAVAQYWTAVYKIQEAEENAKRENTKAYIQASDVISSIGQENELITQEVSARRDYWNSVDELSRAYAKGEQVEGKVALAAATYRKQHFDIMKADADDKRNMRAVTMSNAYEMNALGAESAMFGSDMLPSTDPWSNADDYNKYYAAANRIESSYVQSMASLQNTPKSKRAPNAEALIGAQRDAAFAALNLDWTKNDDRRTKTATDNIMTRIRANREEADRYAEDQYRMAEAAKERERSSMQHLGGGSELWMNASVLGAQQRLNGPTNSSTLWNRGQQPEFWEIVRALKDITDEARRLADATEFTKQMGAPGRPAPAYPNSLSAGAA